MFQSMQQLQELRGIVEDPTSSEYVQALTQIVAGLEYQQLQAVEGLHDEMGIDGVEVTGDPEERQEELLDLVGAISSGTFEDWWFERVIAEHIENYEDARSYAGLSEEAWGSQIETWANGWREKGGEEFDQHTDQDLARLHVERKFGVSLREFEREVVNYSRRDALRTVLAGNFEAVEQGIRAATAAAQEGEGE